MNPRTAALAVAAIATAAISGCSLPQPTAPPVSTSTSAEVDPTACQVDQAGAPDQPSQLLLTCTGAAWALQGPWRDQQARHYDPEQRQGWQVTQARMVHGEGRVWLSNPRLSCVAVRDLLDSASTTRVLCHSLVQNEETTPSSSTAPPPPLTA